MKLVRRAWWSGWLTLFAVISLWQDYLGQQAYLQLVQDRWIDPLYSVPVALVALVVGVELMPTEKDMARPAVPEDVVRGLQKTMRIVSDGVDEGWCTITNEETRDQLIAANNWLDRQ